MTTLYGDKIESLLWENGFEFKHRTYIHYTPEIEVFADTYSVFLGDVWTDDDDWYLDTDNIYYTMVRDGETFAQGYLEDVSDEPDLMTRVMGLEEE